ncbi:MAG: hypothetical protein PHR94_05860 [Methylomonas lenta]|nr:hypothetical protein [Methylomonas lenta]
MLIESLLKIFAELIGWDPIGRAVTVTVTEGESAFFGLTLTGVIRNYNQEVTIELDSPWRFPSQATHTTNWILVQPRFIGHTINRLLLGSWHVNVYPMVTKGNTTKIIETDSVAICEVRVLKRR